MTDNIRGQYWLEATDCIAKANATDMADPRFWAWTLSALVNATMATAPDSVMTESVALTARKKRTQRTVQKDISKNLREKVK